MGSTSRSSRSASSRSSRSASSSRSSSSSSSSSDASKKAPTETKLKIDGKKNKTKKMKKKKPHLKKKKQVSAPMTAAANAGDTVLHLSSTAGLAKGQAILIGGSELNVVAGFGSIILAIPLKKAWPIGTKVTTVKAKDDVKDALTKALKRDGKKMDKTEATQTKNDDDALKKAPTETKLKADKAKDKTKKKKKKKKKKKTKKKKMQFKNKKQ